VEDEQLSLAIGKRGQNVRLAAELLHAKIDVRSESDVKDEVAGALARMLQSEFGESEPKDLDLSSLPGIDEPTAANIQEAGLTSVGAILDSSLDTIEGIEGLDPETAKTLIDWATEKELAEEGKTAALPAVEAESDAPLGGDAASPSSTMGDQDFMAALNKAFQESAGDDETEEVAPATPESGEADASSSESDASDEVDQD
jgi:N utilization substance protein A